MGPGGARRLREWGGSFWQDPLGRPSALWSGQGTPTFRRLPASSKNMKVWADWCGSESPRRALVW